MEVLKRLGTPDKLIRIIASIYRKPIFFVSMQNRKCSWNAQKTGIRQSCPLSLYLFLAVMTVLAYGFHKGDLANTE